MIKSWASLLLIPLIPYSDHVSLDDMVHIWLKAPKVFENFNAARRKHQPKTGSWFLDGSQFKNWKQNTNTISIIYGIRERHSSHKMFLANCDVQPEAAKQFCRAC